MLATDPGNLWPVASLTQKKLNISPLLVHYHLAISNGWNMQRIGNVTLGLTEESTGNCRHTFLSHWQLPALHAYMYMSKVYLITGCLVLDRQAVLPACLVFEHYPNIACLLLF